MWQAGRVNCPGLAPDVFKKILNVPVANALFWKGTVAVIAVWQLAAE